MKKKETASSVKGTKLVCSALIFALCYVVFMLFILLMIVINSPGTWRQYFVENYSQFLSLCICVLLLFYIVYYYYYFEDKQFLVKTRNILLIFSLMILAVLVCYLFGRFVSVFARPMALFALLALLLFNRRQAILLNFVFTLLIFVIDTYTNNFAYVGSGLSPMPGLEDLQDIEMYFSLMLGFVSGTFAVLTAANVKTRGGLLLLGTFISIPTACIILLLELPVIDIHAQGSWISYVVSAGYGILGSFLSSALALCFLPLFEFVFNRLTVFRLRELTSANVPLIRRLRAEAPGTFNHSLIVAQLAETCAIAIGENAELARAGAYFHDVGKLKQPECFTENQTGGYNVHDELTPELSADIIRSHATDGYELLIHARLPRELADIAREHHGTMPIKYFYDKAMRLSGGDAKIGDYSYLGPTPHTKIAAIIMIADASEAAARTLKDRTSENVERVVRSVIEERMDLDQFSDCDITMRELTTIKEAIVDALSGVHHHRVKYPAIRFNRERQAVKDETHEE